MTSHVILLSKRFIIINVTRLSHTSQLSIIIGITHEVFIDLLQFEQQLDPLALIDNNIVKTTRQLLISIF